MTENMNFHMTFPPNPLYLGRILKVADGIKHTTAEIAAITGIPQGASSGKVAPHISYAAYMGLIDQERFTRTALGRIVLAEDPTLSEKLSQLLCHVMLTSATGASMWRFLFRTLLPANHGSVSVGMLDEKMQEQFGAAKYAPVLSTYTKQMTKLGLLECTGDRVSIRSMPVERDMLYVYGYSLLHEWECHFPDAVEITASQLEELRFGAVFGWSEQTEFEVLHRLSDKGIIHLNQQLVPFTVRKLARAEELTGKLYSLLL